MVLPLVSITPGLLAEKVTSEVTSISDAGTKGPPPNEASAVAVVCWKPPGAQSISCSSESASFTWMLRGNHTDIGRSAPITPPEARATLILVLPPLVCDAPSESVQPLTPTIDGLAEVHT